MEGSIFLVPLNRRDEQYPGNNIADADGTKGETLFHSVEVVLISIDKGEGLDEHEHQSVRETGQERQHQYDRLGCEHSKRSHPGDDDLFRGQAFADWRHLVRTPNVHTWIRLAALLGNLVHHDRGPSFRNKDQMCQLDGASKDELDPDAPAPT